MCCCKIQNPYFNAQLQNCYFNVISMHSCHRLPLHNVLQNVFQCTVVIGCNYAERITERIWIVTRVRHGVRHGVRCGNAYWLAERICAEWAPNAEWITLWLAWFGAAWAQKGDGQKYVVACVKIHHCVTITHVLVGSVMILALMLWALSFELW